MRKLYLGNGDKQFKFADTTTEIHLNAFDDGSAADLTADAKVRIKNNAGYLLGVSASITNNHAFITSGQLAQLPAGSYLLELWDTVDGGTAIYPSDGFLALQINENVTGLSGGLVSSITVDDFVQQFSDLSDKLKQEVADAVANGLKGDTGDQGLSAYQIAVINGYHGSQTDWLAYLVGAKGDKGDKGDAGKDFKIVKTFPSIGEMNGDGFSDGDFTMIASDVNDPDDGKLYVWNGTSFTYIADLSGSQGIKGDTGKTGDTGEKGDTGEQGLSAYQVAVNAGFSGTVGQWLASLVGPTGTVDNDGLINSPAFQSLQTQVNNSAVWDNLITGTSSILQTSPDSQNNTLGGFIHWFSSDELSILAGKQVTVRSFIHNTTTHTVNLMMWTNLGGVKVGTDIPAGTDGYSTITTNISSHDTSGNIAIRAYTENVAISGAQYKELKLQMGGIATNWCPNPAEILTQSDYAKIKAAIVALGGTLS